MLIALVIVPLVGAVVSLAVTSHRWRPWILPAVAVVHLAMSVRAAATMIAGPTGAWIGLDPLSRIVLVQVSGIFFLCSWYAPPYLHLRLERETRVFCASLLTFLAMMTFAISARHVALMWVAIEASTLSSAPLLYFNHSRRSIEATWKYLLVGSVGIALALLGSFFLAYSALYAGHESTLLFDDLVVLAPSLSRPWLHGALVFLFIGYGTKMGLAPLHTWKPDAYGEAPGLVGTLLAGAMTSCAFLAVMRFFQIAAAAGEAAFAREMLLATGLFSMAVAAVFMVQQRDFKRMLAYSSVEHMGILAIGVGLGGAGVFGSLFHMVNNGFTKGVLFLSAGNIHRAYRSKRTDAVRGALHRTPISAALFVAGFFAITGAPPFGPFMSELTILDAAIGTQRYIVAGLFLLFLLIVFIGMGSTVLAVVQGPAPEEGEVTHFQDGAAMALPILGFLVVSLLLGVFLPQPLYRALLDASSYVESQ